LGWLDAWTTKPSIYAVAAKNARDIAAAVDHSQLLLSTEDERGKAMARAIKRFSGS
jgi:hypothetical protein